MKFLLHTQIGVENITEVELLNKFKGQYSLDYVGFVPHKNGIVQIDWRSDKNLDFYNKLGTIEDAYFVLEYKADIEPTTNLKEIYKSLNVSKIKQAIDYFFDNLNNFSNSKKFRFVTRKKAAHDFRRIDLEDTIKEFFKKNIPRVEIDGGEGEKEIWTTLIKNRLIITVRLSTKEMRQSYYKTASVDASLRPSVGFAMAYLADITAKESIWLPFCGAGTIGCEISEEFKFIKLMNSDISEEAINAAKVNFSNLKSYKQNKGKITFKVEDFFESKNYADLIIANLPFGNKYDAPEAFLQKFFDKINSIKGLKKFVILYPDIPVHPKWQLTRKFSLQVLGYDTYLMVFKKIN